MRLIYMITCIFKIIAILVIVFILVMCFIFDFDSSINNNSNSYYDYYHHFNKSSSIVDNTDDESIISSTKTTFKLRETVSGTIPTTFLQNDIPDIEIKNELVSRYWNIIKNGGSVSTSNHYNNNKRFFTKERLLNLEKFNLLRPAVSNNNNFVNNNNNGENVKSIFEDDDRIIGQLVLGMEGIPGPDYIPTRPKSIFLLNGFTWWNYKGSGSLVDECPNFKLNQCQIIQDANKMSEADIIITTASLIRPSSTLAQVRAKSGLSPNTKILFYMLESPFVESVSLNDSSKSIDWITNYWRGSDLVGPYDKWLSYEPYNNASTRQIQDFNYAQSKASAKFAAIFTSNCNAQNGRLKLVQALQKYISIDVYGACGTLSCPRSDSASCFELLKRDYKFYLAFENANCRDYISEKFFLNALKHNVIPIVFGGHPSDYEYVSPKHSYIHIEDFGTLEDLGNYLKVLATNETVYNSYFEWKGTGEFIDTKYFCRVCTMLHYTEYIASQLQNSTTAMANKKSTTATPDAIQHSKNDLVLKWDPKHFCLRYGSMFWNQSRNNKNRLLNFE